MSSFHPVAAEPSPLPKPVDHGKRADERMKPLGALVFRGLRGSESLSWLECLALLPDGETNVGAVIIWLRFKGCDIEAVYVAGETRFFLREGVGDTDPSP